MMDCNFDLIFRCKLFFLYTRMLWYSLQIANETGRHIGDVFWQYISIGSRFWCSFYVIITSHWLIASRSRLWQFARIITYSFYLFLSDQAIRKPVKIVTSATNVFQYKQTNEDRHMLSTWKWGCNGHKHRLDNVVDRTTRFNKKNAIIYIPIT